MSGGGEAASGSRTYLHLADAARVAGLAQAVRLGHATAAAATATAAAAVLGMGGHGRIVHGERTQGGGGGGRRVSLVGAQGMVRLLLQLQHVVGLGVEVRRVGLQARGRRRRRGGVSWAQQVVARLRRRRRVDGRVVGILGARRWRILRRRHAATACGARADDFPRERVPARSDYSAVAQMAPAATRVRAI